MPETQPPDPWSLRASDAERDKYLEVLREAYAEGRLDAAEYEERINAALSAKTYRDLLPVVQDLPVDHTRLPRPPMGPAQYPGSSPDPRLPVPRPVSSLPVPGPGMSSGDALIAVFGSNSRRGVWQVPATVPAFTLFGEVKIDLSSAVLAGPVTELKCGAIFGSVEVIVPDALQVEVNGVGVFGSFERKDKRKGANRQRVPAPGAPLIQVTGLALFGSVEVRVVAPKPGEPGVRILDQPPLPPTPEQGQIEGPGGPDGA